ncbi:hypothetical protein G6F22_014273 [Rhizopus arrhizus]|nr:hypothetical protein G6F22_014273 [Rhizopus arrhizus]
MEMPGLACRVPASLSPTVNASETSSKVIGIALKFCRRRATVQLPSARTVSCCRLAAGSETRLTMPLLQATRARVHRTIKAIRKRWSMGASPLEGVRWDKHTTAYGCLDRR